MSNLLQRKAVQQGETEFTFPVRGTVYLVKNFTGADIYAAIGKGFDKEGCALIPAEMAQVITPTTTDIPGGDAVVTVITDAGAGKEVEVQCLRW